MREDTPGRAYNASTLIDSIFARIASMADVFSKKKRSEIMALIRSKNTKPDIVFVSKKVAVFVDGSFWHGHRLKNGQALPRKYWLPKIKRNMERDKEVNLELKKMGWKVIRVWEHDLKKNQKKTLDTIMRILNR